MQKINCKITCDSYNFNETTDQYGCLQCECLCPDGDCGGESGFINKGRGKICY